jgi:hypothetical protein
MGEEDVIVILDQRPELEVILSAIRDPEFEKQVPLASSSSWHPTAIDFIKATRRQPEPIEQPAGKGPVIIGKETWLPNPQFEVHSSDADFILRAAKRTIDAEGIITRARNIVTKRYQAAKSIATFLQTKNVK